MYMYILLHDTINFAIDKFSHQVIVLHICHLNRPDKVQNCRLSCVYCLHVILLFSPLIDISGSVKDKNRTYITSSVTTTTTTSVSKLHHHPSCMQVKRR